MSTKQSRNIRIVGTGSYLPKEKVTSAELDRRLSQLEGSCERSSGVKFRHYAHVREETTSWMGARAAEAALQIAGLEFKDIEALVCVSGTPQQAVPYTASLIQRELGQGNSGVPAFDVNSTCLSFVTGLDTVSYMIQSGRYRRVLFVSTENASNSLDWKNIETASLFGDGACAVVVEHSTPEQSSRILGARMETYSSGANYTRLEAGGSWIHSSLHGDPVYASSFVFQMDGRRVVKLALEVMPSFIEKLTAEAGVSLQEIRLVIPHQASRTGMELVRRKLGLTEERWMDVLENYGNMISVSIPLALHEAIRTERIQRGDKVLLLGTSAGFSVGGVILEY